MDKIKWGILATGRIAHTFATNLAKLDDAELLAVGSRSKDHAADFAKEFDVAHVHGSYAELARDPDVQIVYVASPHPFHMENAILCLEHGKAVCCEKPLALNTDQARRMVSAARENGVFLMEAMWTRFLPVTRQIMRWIDEGRIGEPRLLSADFGFRTAWNPDGRLLNLKLGGGATLDVGVYVVAYAYMIFRRAPQAVNAVAHLGETGVDEQTGILLGYDGGEMANLSSAVRTSTPQRARISGTEGAIDVPDFWHATSAQLVRPNEAPVTFEGEPGYQYEAAEAMACLRDGRTESEIMPLDESIAIAETLETVRDQIGLRYPMEES